MRAAPFHTLRGRVLLLGLLVLTPAVLQILHMSSTHRELAAMAARRQAMGTAQSCAHAYESIVEQTRYMLIALSRLAVMRGDDAAERDQVLREMQRGNDAMGNIGLVDREGVIISSALPISDLVPVADRLWFTRVMEGRGFAAGEFQIGRVTNRPGINFACPVNALDGSVQRVIFAALDLQVLRQYAQRDDLPKGSVVTVVDTNGRVLVRWPEPGEWEGKLLPESPLARAISGLRHSGWVEARGLDGAQRLYAWTPASRQYSRDLVVSVGIPVEVVYADVYRQARNGLLGLAVFIVLAVIATWVGGELFVRRPVADLVATSRKMAAGDLAARARPHRSGELDELARAFNEMAASLQRREAMLEESRAALQKKSDELSRSNAELERFAYVTSHDLQEPLRMVASYTQLLARRYEGKLDKDADEFIGFAVDGAKRMQRLINDLLAYSRVDSRGRELAPTDASEALEEALQNLDVTIRENGAVVEHDPLPTVRADRMQLVQVFQNLVGNAIKFRSEHPPEIHVSAQRANGQFVFAVRDNGIGIERQYWDRIFVVFQRLHTRDKYPGTGIGLAICKRIVERHGGRIWVESTPGTGSTFYFAVGDEESRT